MCAACACSVHFTGNLCTKYIRLLIQIHFLFFHLHPDSPSMTYTGSVHPMVTVTPSPLAGPALQPPPKRSAESSPSHSHSHSHSQMSRNSSRKSNNSVNCKIDGKIFHEFNQSVYFLHVFYFDLEHFQIYITNGVGHFLFIMKRKNVLTCP